MYVWSMCAYVYDMCMCVIYVCNVCMCVMYVGMCVYDVCVIYVCVCTKYRYVCIATLCAVCRDLWKNFMSLCSPFTVGSSRDQTWVLRPWGNVFLPTELSCHLRGFLECLVKWPWRHLSCRRCPVNVTFLSSSEKDFSHSKLQHPAAQSLCNPHTLSLHPTPCCSVNMHTLPPPPLPPHATRIFPSRCLLISHEMHMFSAVISFKQNMCGRKNHASLFSFVQYTPSSTFILKGAFRGKPCLSVLPQRGPMLRCCFYLSVYLSLYLSVIYVCIVYMCMLVYVWV